MAEVILIFGASGSGKTTLGRALGEALHLPHFDTDDFYWVRTDPPYQVTRPYDAIESLLAAQIAATDRCVVSGAVRRYPSVAAQVAFVVFLTLDNGRRMDRLMAREQERYGDRCLPGGDMYATHIEFMDWAATYEVSQTDATSRLHQERWLDTLTCPVLRLNADRPVEALLSDIRPALREKGIMP